MSDQHAAKGNQLQPKLKIHRSITDRIAVWITDTFGSMLFLFLCVVMFVFWILWNLGFLHSFKPFDPYPFTMLTMIVSLFAIILSVAVLISQNREGRLDSRRQQTEFEVSVHAEKEITKVLNMLHEIQMKLGIDTSGDAELEEMKENLDIQGLHDSITESEEKKV